MARARNIKPAFFENEELVELPFSTRLLFIGLWTMADREGRLEDRPKKIKMNLFPADNLEINEALQELHDAGFLLRYQVDGKRFIQVVTFEKHQNPHRDEKASLIPPQCEHGASMVQAQCEHGASMVAIGLIPDSLSLDSLNLIPDSLSSDSPIPDSQPTPIVEGKPPTARIEHDQVVEVFDYWQQTMNHPTARLDAKREKAIKTRLKNGYTVGNLCTAIEGCKYDPWSQGANDRNAVYDDIELICRDGPKVDKFIAIAGRGPQTIRPANTQATFDTIARILNKEKQHEN